MPKTPLENMETLALAVTRAVGSVWSVIIHTIMFLAAFSLILFGVRAEIVLLVLTTLVSLEAIYLSIFIQLSVNHQARQLADVEKDIDEIHENVEDIAEDVDEIQEDIDEIQKDVDEIQEDVDEIQEDVEDIHEHEQGVKP